MARRIVVTSGKGGVGKTTVVTHVSRELAKKGKRVLVVDADFGLNNLDVEMGVERDVSYDLFDVLDGKCRIKQALVYDKEYPNLAVLCSDKIRTDLYFTAQNVKAALLGLGSVFDYIFIDSPAGVDEGFVRSVSLADEALIVTTSSLSSLRDADKVLSRLEPFGLNPKVVVNRVRGDLILDGAALSTDEIAGLLKVPVVGVVPDDDAVLLSAGRKLSCLSRAGKAFFMLAAALDQNTEKVYDATKKYRGFFGGIKRAIRKSL